MKKLIALVLALVCVLGLVGCNSITKTPNEEVNDNIEATNDFYADVKTIEICVGSTKFHFDKAEDVESICKLFEDVVGNKVPDDEEQVEGFYEITFSKDGKETTVILTGPTIIIDGIRYYTTKAITQPLSEYLVEPTTNTHSKNEIHQIYPSGKVYDVVLSFANHTENSDVYTHSLNLSKMQSDSIQHLPIYKFDTVEDLEQFKELFGDVLTMDSTWDEVPSFNDATAKYDKEFFNENSLLLVYISVTNSTHRFGLSGIEWNNNSLSVRVTETTGAEEVVDAMAGWFLTIAVEDESIATCTDFDAFFANTETSE